MIFFSAGMAVAEKSKRDRGRCQYGDVAAPRRMVQRIRPPAVD